MKCYVYGTVSCLDSATVDLINALKFSGEPRGVTRVDGMCESRGDVAYRLSDKVLPTASTANFYPDGFPRDFSILVTVKPAVDTTKATVFTVYSDSGEEQIAVTIGDDVNLYYKDTDSEHLEGIVVSFGANVNDGQ